MVTGKIILQTLGGLTSVTAVTAVIYNTTTSSNYIEKEQIFDGQEIEKDLSKEKPLVISKDELPKAPIYTKYLDLEEHNDSHYLLVSPKTINTLFTDGIKDYKCQISTYILDNNCTLYKYLSIENIIDFNEIKLSENVLQQNDPFNITDNYILRLSAEKYLGSEGNNEIKLFKKDGSSFDLEVKHDLYKDEETIKSDFFIAKAIKAENEDFVAGSTFKCTVLKKEIPCFVKQLKISDLAKNTAHSTINNNKTKLTEKTMTEAKAVIDTYYLIKLSGDKQTIKDLKSSKITITATSAPSTTKKYGEFKYQQLLLGSFDAIEKILFFYERAQTFVVTSTADSNAPAKELWVDNSSKNYKCKITTNEDIEVIDENCELYEIEYSDKSTANINDIKYIYKELKKSDQLNEKTFYKLKVFSKANTLNIKTVDLLSPTSSPAEETTLSTLTTKFELKNTSLHGKASFFLGRATWPAIDKDQAFKCKIKEEKEKHDCQIYISSLITEDKNQLPSLNLSSITEEKSKEAAEANTGYVLVNFKEHTYLVDSDFYSSILKTSKIEIYKESEETKLFDLTIESALAINFESPNATKGIFLNV